MTSLELTESKKLKESKDTIDLTEEKEVKEEWEEEVAL
jgi:hypothetical protein